VDFTNNFDLGTFERSLEIIPRARPDFASNGGFKTFESVMPPVGDLAGIPGSGFRGDVEHRRRGLTNLIRDAVNVTLPHSRAQDVLMVLTRPTASASCCPASE
jgi:hypothetical protein